MDILSRREVVKALAAAAAVAPALGQAQDAPASASVGDAFAGSHQPIPLPFDPTQLEGLSERLISSHWQNNYQGSVNALNAIKQRLASALGEDDLPAYVYNDLKREHLMRTGSAGRGHIPK